jgi:Asp-tRNA(Asn)/Glu-tRNA(Gln) amidotransferase A subunit family amidase
LRVAYSEDLGFAPLDDGVRARYGEALAAFERAGADLVPIPEELGFTSSVQTWAIIAAAEARWSQNELLTVHRLELSEQVRQFLAFGEAFTAEQYIAAQFERERIHERYVRLFASRADGGLGVDVLFTPTVGCSAFDVSLAFPPLIGGRVISDPWRDWASFLYDANLAGLPALSLPIGVDEVGLPVGGQLVGPRRRDRTVLYAGAVLEASLKRSSGSPCPPIQP